MTEIKTFICSWRKSGGCSPDEYIRPVDEIGGVDNETGEPICQDCADGTQGEQPDD